MQIESGVTAFQALVGSHITDSFAVYAIRTVSLLTLSRSIGLAINSGRICLVVGFGSIDLAVESRCVTSDRRGLACTWSSGFRRS